VDRVVTARQTTEVRSQKSEVQSRARARGRRTLDAPLPTFFIIRRPTFLFFLVALLAPACAVREQRAELPAAAQTAIDTLSDDIAAGRDDKIYAEAADEWRQAATADESRAQLARVRNAFGRVLSRVLVTGRAEQATNGGQAVTATFNTRFERADAIETFTLIERDGRWQLARYAVHSDALKP
jgi:hypothetical protein